MKKAAGVAALALILVGCGAEPTDNTVGNGKWVQVYETCKNGDLVYFSETEQGHEGGGGVFVLPDDPKCAEDESPDPDPTTATPSPTRTSSLPPPTTPSTPWPTSSRPDGPSSDSGGASSSSGR